MKRLVEQLATGLELSNADVEEAVAALLSVEVADADKAEFLVALSRKGETANEIAAFVDALLVRAIDPQIDPTRLGGPMIDVCGTGGDRLSLFNVSTTVMFVLAAGGAVVVKHGNRGISSRSGGADVLEKLGVRIDFPPAELRDCLQRTGIGFLFAPQYHPAFAAVAAVRRQLAASGVRTIFNLLGPLLNPARPPRQLIGVFSPNVTKIFAQVLQRLGRECAWAVHGEAENGAGMDELSTIGLNRIAKATPSAIVEEMVTANSLGLGQPSLEELRGGNADDNCAITEGILRGDLRGPKRDLVALNAAAGFVIAGLAKDLAEGLQLAFEKIESGAAFAKLQTLREFCRSR